LAENIFIGVAWPYASGPIHVGQVAGAILPADIFARYQRLKGNRVLMVSGSDQHGTPITLKAEQMGKTPAELVAGYHRIFLENWEKLGITFDLFTTTGTPNHAVVVHDLFLAMLEKGYIYKQSMAQAWCPKCARFLPDRYVEGTCPFCGFVPARGDQCDSCGRPLNPSDIPDLKCRLCGSHPEFKDSEHFFLKLSAFEQPLRDWVRPQSHWRANVQKFTLGYLEEGLHDRAITRDLEWGIPLPLPGYEGKCIYVWFEAVIGYLSASKEWAQKQGEPDAWQPFWGKDARAYYFIGKDNIPFHSIIWPAMLMAYGKGLALPYDVPSNEFLTIEGKKLSTSRNWAVWLPDYLSRYAPDPLRYCLAAGMPETNDTDFSWTEYLRRNNDELVATFGNLAHRTLTFLQRNYEGRVPEPGALDPQSNELLAKAKTALNEVDRALSVTRFKEALKSAMGLAQEGNKYLDYRAPWKMFKTDKATAGASLYVILSVLSALKTAFAPFLPFTAARLQAYLGLPGTVDEAGWQVQPVVPGTRLPPPEPLFLKLEDKIVAEETARLGQPFEK
jgi:methionyl-tRNA synthetase